MEGYLLKQGHIFASWNSRWFCLEGNVLRYYIDQTKSKKKGEYILKATSRTERVPDVQDKKYAEGSGGNEMLMSAPDDRARAEWEKAIGAVISRMTGDSSPSQSASELAAAAAPALSSSTQAFSYKVDSAHEIGDVGVPSTTTFSTVLNIKYNGRYVSEGEIVLPATVRSPPFVTYKHRPDRFYCLVMTDPDAPSRDEPLFREYVHWVVMNIPGDRVVEGDVVLPYVGAAPPMNSGLHRYVFMLFCQQTKLNVDEARQFYASRAPLQSLAWCRINKANIRLDGVTLFQAEWDKSVDQLHAFLGFTPPQKYQSRLQRIVNTLPTHKSANTMMLLGSTVADCATLALHGLDQHAVSALLAGLPEIEEGGTFFDPPRSSFNYAQGCGSPYAQFVQCFRRSLAETGVIRPDDIAEKVCDHFRAALQGSDIPPLCEAYVSARNAGRPWASCAQNSTRSPHALVVVPTIVARYAGSHQLSKAVRNATRVIQINDLVDTACSLMSILLERCVISKCSPVEAMLYFSNPLAGGGKLTHNEFMLLTSGLTDSALARVKDIHEIVGMHPSLAAVDDSDEAKKQAPDIARILSTELICGGGGQGGSAAILLDNAPLSSAQKTFWSEAKQAAKAANRANNDDVMDISLNEACSLFGTGSTVIEVVMCVLYIIRHCSSYSEAIVKNIAVGGDSCARAILLGAFFAVPHHSLPEGASAWRPGGGMIPVEWIDKCNDIDLENVLRDGNDIRGARRKVLVVGLSGLIGAKIVKNLCANYLSCATVVGATRNVDSPCARKLLSSVTGSGLELIRTDMSDQKSLQEALKGVSTVMIVTPGAENREELVNGVVVACRAAGSVSHIVALSMLTATREDMLVGGQFSRIEGMIATCGMDYTILRLPLLMESTLAHVRTVQREQKIRGSLAPCSTFVVVAAADVARAAATVLANPSAHTNKTYSLTGSVITMEMVAGAYSNASGLDVTYTQDSVERTRKAMSIGGKPDWVVAATMELFHIIDDPDDQTFSSMSSDLSTLLSPQLELSPLCTLDGFIADFYSSGGARFTEDEEIEAALGNSDCRSLTDEELKQAMLDTDTEIPSIFNGRWADKKTSVECRYQRRFIWIDPITATFHWSKKEGKLSMSKFIKLSKDLGVSVSDVTVATMPAARRRSILSGGDAAGVMFSVGDEKGTIDLKFPIEDPTSEEEARGWIKAMQTILDRPIVEYSRKTSR